MKNKTKKRNDIKIKVPVKDNELLAKVQAKINKNKEIETLWKVINVNAIERLNMPDHGSVHFQIVANIALRFARILNKQGVKMSIEVDHELSYKHAELVIFLASLLHDIGMTISREGHEEFSLFIARPLLEDILDFLPIEKRTILVYETLHAIIGHRSGGKPLTIEAGIVRVADALDVSEGRSRIPYESGVVNIHSVSHAAIDKVDIKEGQGKPLKIEIVMNNSAGVFQVDELLKNKILGSGLEKYLDVKAYVGRKKEKKLIKEFRVKV